MASSSFSKPALPQASDSTFIPNDPAYKKAHRLHLKSTKQRPSDDSFQWTPFRAAEKKYKAKFPPPDLSEVLDLSLMEADSSKSCGLSWKGSPEVVDAKPIYLKGRSNFKGYIIPQVPGLVILPGYLSPSAQRSLVLWSLRDHARPPNETNLDTHYDLPVEGLWRTYESLATGSHDIQKLVPPKISSSNTISEPPGPRQLISNIAAGPSNYQELSSEPKPPAAPSTSALPTRVQDLIPRLRWANIGWHYHWGTKQYDFSRGKIPVDPVVNELCREIVRSIPWEDVFASQYDTVTSDEWGDGGPDWQEWGNSYEPDAGIVNYYQLKDTLMAHVDRSELCATSPLVSISLGNAAIFLIGGQTRDEKPIAVSLRSGDIVIMSGPRCRRAYHGVPRILEGTLPSHFELGENSDASWKLAEEYLKSTRININVRQVFPKGFKPEFTVS